MSILRTKYNIPLIIASFLVSFFINNFLKMIFDFSVLMPFYIYWITVVLESSIIFMVAKRIVKDWTNLDKYIVSILYFCFILTILFGRYGYGGRWIQLNPFACIREFCYGSEYERLIFAFNIVSFIPVPIFLEVFTKDVKKSVLLSILFGMSIEVIQLVTYTGVFDLGDMALYFTGICFGYVYLKRNEIWIA